MCVDSPPPKATTPDEGPFLSAKTKRRCYSSPIHVFWKIRSRPKGRHLCLTRSSPVQAAPCFSKTERGGASTKVLLARLLIQTAIKLHLFIFHTLVCLK